MAIPPVLLVPSGDEPGQVLLQGLQRPSNNDRPLLVGLAVLHAGQPRHCAIPGRDSASRRYVGGVSLAGPSQGLNVREHMTEGMSTS